MIFCMKHEKQYINQPFEYQIFCELLRDIRLERNIRQTGIAEYFHQPQSFVSKYESGERRIDAIELMHLCQFFNISIAEFYDRLQKKIADYETKS